MMSPVAVPRKRRRSGRARQSAEMAVIPLDIPPILTAPNQTALNRNAAQPDLPRPYWTVDSRRWAVIS
jgi:hypothetical protein